VESSNSVEWPVQKLFHTQWHRFSTCASVAKRSDCGKPVLGCETVSYCGFPDDSGLQTLKTGPILADDSIRPEPDSRLRDKGILQFTWLDRVIHDRFIYKCDSYFNVPLQSRTIRESENSPISFYMSDIAQQLLGLLILLGVGLSLVFSILILLFIWGLTHPSHVTEGTAAARGWWIDPSDAGYEYEEWNLDRPKKIQLPIWSITNEARPQGPVAIISHCWGGSRIESLQRVPFLLSSLFTSCALEHAWSCRSKLRQQQAWNQ